MFFNCFDLSRWKLSKLFNRNVPSLFTFLSSDLQVLFWCKLSIFAKKSFTHFFKLTKWRDLTAGGWHHQMHSVYLYLFLFFHSFLLSFLLFFFPSFLPSLLCYVFVFSLLTFLIGSLFVPLSLLYFSILFPIFSRFNKHIIPLSSRRPRLNPSMSNQILFVPQKIILCTWHPES